ncbi:RNA-binding protein [Comamonas aquatica]|nr:RNA-binding protein [Comamonas aquatica]
MQNKLYVSNLAFSLDSDALRKLFTNYGTVTSSQVILDRDSGRSRGFAFVEMSTSEAAAAAVQGLNGQPTEGRSLNVAIARERN